AENRYDEARALYEQSLAVFREIGMPEPAGPYSNLGWLALRQQDYEAAGTTWSGAPLNGQNAYRTVRVTVLRYSTWRALTSASGGTRRRGSTARRACASSTWAGL